MANPILKIKRGSGTPVSLQVGEIAFDTTNKSFFIGTAEGVLPIGGEHIFAKKTFVNDAVASEASIRSSADSTLTSNLNAEISRAQGAEGVNAAAITAEETARIAAVSAEQSAREAADTTLDGKITTEKGRIDAILSAADADKDSFAEIVSLINSVDTTNDTVFAGYVSSNDAALAQEVSDRTAADTALGVRIDSAEGVSSALDTRVTAAESDIVDNAAAISAEETARIAAVSAEASARSSADTTLQGNIDSEASTRAAADTSLSNRLDSLEAVSSDSRLTDLEADVADHETRITALETTIDGGTY
jgi:trimeric autotransporter adhesin